MRIAHIRIVLCAALCACAASCRYPNVRYDKSRNIVVARDFGRGPDFPVREVYWRGSVAWPRAFRMTGWDNIREDDFLGRCHTFGKIVGAKEFFEDHPEYFALRGGKRLRELTQPCLTNPDVLRIAKERVVKRVLENPKAKFFGISQNDNRNYCTCPACTAVDMEEGSHAGTVVRFVNAIAAEVAKVRKDAVVTTLAYMYSRKPPKTPLAPNAAVWLCTTDVDFSRPLDGGGKENDAFMEDLRGWKAKAPMGVYIWDYSINFRHMQMPFPNLRAMAGNFRVYRENGVKGVFFQGAGPGTLAPFGELKTYLASRLLWDSCASADEVVREFTDAFYGKAAAKVREIIDFLEDIPKTVTCFDESIYAKWLDDAAIEKLDAMWREAESLAAGNPEHGFNARMGRLSPVYTRFTRAICRMTKRGWLCSSPPEYCRKEEALADLKWMHERVDEAKSKKKGKVVFSGTERHTKVAGLWSYAMMKPFPEKGVDSLTIPASSFSPDGRMADGSTNVLVRVLDDIAFDSGTDYSIVLSGLPPGCRAGLRDGETGAELSDAASGVVAENGRASLRLLAPVPVLEAKLWLAMPPDSRSFSSVTIGISRPAANDGSQLKESGP